MRAKKDWSLLPLVIVHKLFPGVCLFIVASGALFCFLCTLVLLPRFCFPQLHVKHFETKNIKWKNLRNQRCRSLKLHVPPDSVLTSCPIPARDVNLSQPSLSMSPGY